MVQLVLEVVYCATYRPFVLIEAAQAEDGMAEGEPVKALSLLEDGNEDVRFMKFTAETVGYLIGEILPFISV